MKNYEKLPAWKVECCKYAESKGYIVSDACSIFLNNVRESDYEIFDFSSYDSFIQTYPDMDINEGEIYTLSHKYAVMNVQEFKYYLNQIDLTYKNKLVELKQQKIDEDF